MCVKVGKRGGGGRGGKIRPSHPQSESSAIRVIHHPSHLPSESSAVRFIHSPSHPPSELYTIRVIRRPSYIYIFIYAGTEEDDHGSVGVLFAPSLAAPLCLSLLHTHIPTVHRVLSLSLSLTHTHITHAHTRTRAHTHAHTHTRAQGLKKMITAVSASIFAMTNAFVILVIVLCICAPPYLLHRVIILLPIIYIDYDLLYYYLLSIYIYYYLLYYYLSYRVLNRVFVLVIVLRICAPTEDCTPIIEIIYLL